MQATPWWEKLSVLRQVLGTAEPSLRGDLRVQVYPPRPKNKKPPVPELAELQSQGMVKHPDPAGAPPFLYGALMGVLNPRHVGLGGEQPGLPRAMCRILEGLGSWDIRPRDSQLLGTQPAPSSSSWAWTGIATGAQHTLPDHPLRAKDKPSKL